MTRAQAIQWRQRQSNTVVFTNGCFDLLHPGHVVYLEQARSLGHGLVVGVNSDESVARLKGPTRPIQTQEARATVLAALASVDGVVVFDEDTPMALLQVLQPDIHVKGGDYTIETLPEYPIVRGYGGNVVIVPFEPGYSTSHLVSRILNHHAK